MITIRIDESKVCCPMCQRNGPFKLKDLRLKESYWLCMRCDAVFPHLHEGIEGLND